MIDAIAFDKEGQRIGLEDQVAIVLLGGGERGAFCGEEVGVELVKKHDKEGKKAEIGLKMAPDWKASTKPKAWVTMAA